MSIIVAFLLASASGAPDQAAIPAPVTTAVPAKPTKEKKICKTEDSDPGSHMVKRICKTEAEWLHQQGVLESDRAGFSVSGEKMEGH